MYDIDRMDTTQKLLYDILQTLKSDKASINKVVLTQIPKVEKPLYKECKYCGAIHEKPSDYAHCARKHKKDGANNGHS